MKSLMVAASLFLVLWTNHANADLVPQEKEVVIGLNGAYVPAGFDSGSDAYVIVNGIFQNSCYQWKRADIKNTDQFTHEIQSIATVKQGMCLMVLVPFQKEVQLGHMASGKHNLRFANGDGTYFDKTMVVE